MNPAGTGENVLALVAGEPITVDQVLHRLAEIRGGPLASLLPDSGPENRRGRRWVLRLLVTEAIVSHHAGFMSGPSSVSQASGSPDEVDGAGAAALADAAERLFDNVTSRVTVANDDVHGYYTRNLDRYFLPERRLLRHRIEKDLTSAQQVAVSLVDNERASTRFEMRRGEFAGPLEDAVFAAHTGELIGPIESELGWHVAIVEAIFESGYMPFEQVRSDIELDLLSVARGRAFDQWLEQQRRALAIVTPGWGHPGDPTLPDFSHRH